MQAAADVVAAVLAAELAAGVQLRHHDVDGRHTGGVHRDRDAAAVVADLDATVLEESHLDSGGVSGHRLVDRVVDDLPHEVVQTALAGGADIHARTFADGLQPLENGDAIGRRTSSCAFFFAAATGGSFPTFGWGCGSTVVITVGKSSGSVYRPMRRQDRF